MAEETPEFGPTWWIEIAPGIFVGSRMQNLELYEADITLGKVGDFGTTTITASFESTRRAI